MRARNRRRTLHSVTWLVIATLVGLLILSTTVTVVARSSVARAVHELSDRLLPASQAASALGKAYVDQETGQRGFLLTGDREFLRPFDDGQAAALRQRARLHELLGTDHEALTALDQVEKAAGTWQSSAAAPEIAARRRGTLGADQLSALTLKGKELFDALRQRLTTLETRTSELTAQQVKRISSAQLTANVVAIASILLAVLTAFAAVPLLHRLLARPLGRLLGQIRTVADGAYDHAIDADGPREITAIAGAVNRMRGNILRNTRELARHEEQSRMAADLQDSTIQQVFALGMALSSAAARHPGHAAELAPLIADTDRIVRNLRTAIFDLTPTHLFAGLRVKVNDVVKERSRDLGFTPALEFTGPVDTLSEKSAADALLAALRERLGMLGRATEATVSVTATTTALRLEVTTDAAEPFVWETPLADGAPG
ncbi:sensor domain CHASE3-containing protein [Amycolatopsis xylanica]|uniref:Sensor domain CHASE3-containing protein n=1 Tax=Amycolatopsis xylanica TaxID=589385 RepID=A0A1H2VZR5_9PSEU|nr:CHASE3 domain-containing protein [Amycolatopsis xylanica]SDW73687.1 sensor domain CHASE3-containing protein [Amycolatopsis xylanica]